MERGNKPKQIDRGEPICPMPPMPPMPPSRWSWTSASAPSSNPIFTPPFPQGPPKKTLRPPLYGLTAYVTPSSYAFKSHSWWQILRHTKTARRHPPCRRYVPDHAPLSASETNTLATWAVVTRERLRYSCCTTLSSHLPTVLVP